jgi:hypothetical protein
VVLGVDEAALEENEREIFCRGSPGAAGNCRRMRCNFRRLRAAENESARRSARKEATK